MKLRKDDVVIITTGKDKGKTGKVIRVMPKKNKVLVEGVNQYKRHVKARTAQQKSEIITITKPLPVSNVAFFDSKSKKPARIGYVIEGDEKVRLNKRSGAKL